jgi:hypothetical protein
VKSKAGPLARADPKTDDAGIISPLKPKTGLSWPPATRALFSFSRQRIHALAFDGEFEVPFSVWFQGRERYVTALL